MAVPAESEPVGLPLHFERGREQVRLAAGTSAHGRGAVAEVERLPAGVGIL